MIDINFYNCFTLWLTDLQSEEFFSTSSGRELNTSGKSSASLTKSSHPCSGSQSQGFLRWLFSRDKLPVQMRCKYENPCNTRFPITIKDYIFNLIILPLIKNSSSSWGTPSTACSILMVMLKENSNLCLSKRPNRMHQGEKKCKMYAVILETEAF